MDKGILIEYESMLLGKKRTISPFFFSGPQEADERKALEIFRYAFTTYRKNWDVRTLRDCISLDLIQKLQLKPFMKFIQFPPELDSEKDLFYLVWRLYPKSIHINRTDLTINVYKNLLAKKIQRFPKEFFSGTNGVIRAEICLKYMIEQFLAEENVENIYQLFASLKIIPILRKYRLLTVSSDLFSCPLEYFHASLPKTQKDEILYHYYNFLNKYDQGEGEIK